MIVEQQLEPAPKPKRDVLPIISLSVAAVSVLLSAGIWYFTSTKIDDISAKLESENRALRQENALLTTTQQALSDQLGAMKNIVFFNAMAREIEGATVTDDFVVEKVYFNASDAGTLGNIVIDVDNQPDMVYAYKGKGAYDLSDRELRAKCEAIVDEVQARYGSSENIPAWDDSTVVTLTVKNYEIGNAEGGKFKLVGETK